MMKFWVTTPLHSWKFSTCIELSSLSPATHSLCQIFDLVNTNNYYPSKSLQSFHVTPSSTQNPIPKILHPHPDLPSNDSLTPFDPLHFVLPLSPSVGLQVQHSNHLSAAALYSWPLSFQHIISLVRSKSACSTLAPNSWMHLGENSHTDWSHFLGALSMAASPHFHSQFTFPKSETSFTRWQPFFLFQWGNRNFQKRTSSWPQPQIYQAVHLYHIHCLPLVMQKS